MSILGIDLSTCSTGLARIRSNGVAFTWTVTSKGKRTDTLAMRADRIARLANAISGGVTSSDTLVVLESPSYSSIGSGTWDRAGLWWSVVLKLNRRQVPIALAAPSTVKKWACGNGRAGKKAVQKAMAELYPTVAMKTSDEADALSLAHIGAFHEGYETLPFVAARHCSKTLAAVKWPERMDL